MRINRPEKNDYPEYYEKYIAKVSGDPLTELKTNYKTLRRMVLKLGRKDLNFRYAPGKWTIKEILVHLMDGERVFCYRALRFARKDTTELPGFEENEWVPNSNANNRKLRSILGEYLAVRNSTIELFSNMNKDMLNSSGIANGKPISVRSILYVITGHEIHHTRIMLERYIEKSYVPPR
ncbi:MAG: DinB family protein [Chitinophagaceae bacterium]|nr:DinB family protein [Chitinophagaceae bacterium]